MTDPLLALATDAARARCRAEIELLGSVLCRPALLLPVALDCGATPDAFAFPDLRLAFEAACFARRREVADDDLPWFVARAFRAAGWWRDPDPARQLGDMLDSQDWSTRMVWALFHQNFPDRTAPRRAFATLAAHIRAGRESDEHLAHAVRLLGGAAPAIGAGAAGLALVKGARLMGIPVAAMIESMDGRQERRVA